MCDNVERNFSGVVQVKKTQATSHKSQLRYSFCCYFVQDGDTALHDAACNGHEGVVQRLLKGDANVNATGQVCD